MVKNEISNQIENFVSRISRKKGLIAVYLFGSFGSKNFGEMSDVDICLIGKFSQDEKLDILSKTDEILDISFFEDLPIWIKSRVFFEGKLLFCKNQVILNRMKILTLSEYLDFKPVIDSIINSEFRKCMI